MKLFNIKATYVLIFFLIFLSSGCSKKKPELIRVAYASKWNELVPPLQNNYNASVILVNIFQPLLDIDSSGGFVPVGAKKWEVSEDFTIFKFEIDTENRFSDGSRLTAYDYKRSWERGIELGSAAYNHSLGDVLYKVKGFSGYKKNKAISGIIARSESQLEIHFSTPFRRGLDEIRGARFAAFKEFDGKFLGSGPYKIESQEKGKALLSPNKFYSKNAVKNLMQLSVIKTKDAISAIKNDQIDIFVSGRSHQNFFDIENDKNLSIKFGQYTTHASLAINGKKGRFFSDSKSRLAFQYLVQTIMDKNKNFSKSMGRGFKNDMQFFLPFQSGRISDENVSQHILEGKKYVNYFFEKNKNRPLFFVHGSMDKYIFDELRKMGVKFTENSGSFTHAKLDFWKEIKENFKTDIISSVFSINHGDPDGVYHKLGKEGAIHVPTIYRKKVSEMLDQGRSIFDHTEIDPFYKNISLEILKSVPMVHLGFYRSVVVFNSKKIKPMKKILRRNDSYLNGFEINDD